MMQVETIRVVVAEDHLVTRLGLRSILHAHTDVKVVAEATNGIQLISCYRAHRPDVAVTDMLMPMLSGFEAVAAIRHEFEDARFVALSTYGGTEDIRRAVRAGVQAYLTKDVLDTDIVTAIRTVHKRGTYFPGLTAASVEDLLAGEGTLSERERQVLDLIVPGLSNKQIAIALNIAEYTVKNHVRSILSKLGAEDRTQAAVLAIQRGMVHIEH